MKSLATLIKLQKTLVDEQRQVLAGLLERLDTIEFQIAQLEIRKTRELEAAKDEHARATYGAFLKNMVTQERVLEKDRHTALMAVKIAQDRLAVLFEEQKRYEIAEEKRIDDEAREERRRERIDLDEIGAVIHERRKEDKKY
jgi:hypothetical protein